jgi:fatty acid-binding protein DegV
VTSLPTLSHILVLTFSDQLSQSFPTQQLASDSFVKILLNPGKVFILHLLHFVAVFVFESFLVNRKLLKSY